SWLAPGETGLCEHVVRLFRTPTARFVKRERRFVRPPRCENRIDVRPLRFDFVVTGEQRRVSTHRVDQESLVSFRRFVAEGGGIAEIHGDIAHCHALAWDFRCKTERDTFIRLNAKYECVWLLKRGTGEQRMRQWFEVQGDFGHAFTQAFTRPKK